VLKLDALNAKTLHKFGESVDAVDNRLNGCQLGANVHLNANWLEELTVAGSAVDVNDFRRLDSKLALFQASRDVGVSFRIDVRIDSHRDPSDAALGAGDPFDR